MPSSAASSADDLGQPDDAVLGRDIGRLEGRGDQAVRRGDVDDAPEAARASSAAAPARMVWKAADRLIARTASHFPGGKSSIGATCWMPALLTRMSTRPKRGVRLTIMRQCRRASPCRRRHGVPARRGPRRRRRWRRSPRASPKPFSTTPRRPPPAPRRCRARCRGSSRSRSPRGLQSAAAGPPTRASPAGVMMVVMAPSSSCLVRADATAGAARRANAAWAACR